MMKERVVRDWRQRTRSVRNIGGESRTKQGHKEECDINLIMARYLRHGVLDHLAKYAPRYGDFVDMPQSLDEALNMVDQARELFMSVPASIREKFGNDPQRYLEFCLDPANAQEIEELGLGEVIKQRGSEQSDPLTPRPSGGGETVQRPEEGSSETEQAS